MIKNRKLRGFISAPIQTDTAIIKNILSDLNVQVFDIYTSDSIDNIFGNIQERIKKSDFVIAILSGGSSNVLFEIGIATGHGKPIFLIIDKEQETPSFLQNIIHLNSSLKDTNLLKLSLHNFINKLASTKNLQTKSSRGRSAYLSTSRINHYLNRINLIRENGTGREFESLFADLFKDLNLRFALNPNYKDLGIDIALWNDNLTYLLGNPIFVELKLGTLNDIKIAHAESQLREYVSRSGAQTGLLFYLDKSHKRFLSRYEQYPLIFRFDAEDFIKELSNNSFESLITKKRNSIVHQHS